MNNSMALMNEAVRLHRAGRLPEAESLYRRVILLEPRQYQAHSNLGALFRASGRPNAAEESYRGAIAIKPDFAEAYANLANLIRSGRPLEALALYEQAIALKADVGFFYNYGLALQSVGRAAEAEAAYRRAVAMKPDFADAWNNLGVALADQNRLEEAEETYRRAIAASREPAQSYNNLGLVVLEQGAASEAARLFDKAITLKPDYLDALGNRALTELYRPGVTLADMQQLASRWATQAPLPPAAGSRGSLGSLPRLGFVSADLRRHAVGFLIMPVLEGLARRGFEIACYSNSSARDPLTERFHASATLWRDISSLNDVDAAAQIRADGIDILFDLSGHSRGGRLSLFASKPAPVQVAWIGYPATTGLAGMDYLLADLWQTPAGADAFYTEAILRLKRPYTLFEPAEGVPEPGPLPALENGFVTFASFNALKKINGAVIGVWARILGSVDRSRLILKSPALQSAKVRRGVTQAFVKAGVEEARLTMLGSSSPQDHMAAMTVADIALDPFPYCGGLTTLEALWMGLPVISMPGETFASRHSLTYLNACGLGDFVAPSVEAYEEAAIALATDVPRLAALRESMRARVAASPLMDRDGFITELTEVLTGIWKRS